MIKIHNNILYINDMFWDINNFVPNLKKYLEPNKNYDAQIKFSTEYLYDGRMIKYPKLIILNNIEFKNIF